VSQTAHEAHEAATHAKFVAARLNTTLHSVQSGWTPEPGIASEMAADMGEILDYIARLERVVDVTPGGWNTFRLAGSSLDARTGA
jgi:hypothetical protein